LKKLHAKLGANISDTDEIGIIRFERPLLSPNRY
jgi:hypothetical protein